MLENFATANSSSRLQDLVVSRPAPIKGFAGQFVVLRIRNPGLIDDAGEREGAGAYRNTDVSIGSIPREAIRWLSRESSKDKSACEPRRHPIGTSVPPVRRRNLRYGPKPCH